MGEAPDMREQEDCPGGEFCGYACDQHEGRSVTALPEERRAQLRAQVAQHRAARAVMVHGEVRWICEGCGQPLTLSDPAAAFGDLTTHQADAVEELIIRWLAEERCRFRIAAELVVQDVRAQRGDHIAGLVEDSFEAHFDRAQAITQEPRP